MVLSQVNNIVTFHQIGPTKLQKGQVCITKISRCIGFIHAIHFLSRINTFISHAFFLFLFGRQEELLFLTLTRTNQFHSQGTYTKGLQGWEKNLRNGVGYKYQIETIFFTTAVLMRTECLRIVPKGSIIGCNLSAIANNHPGDAFSISCMFQ